MRTIGILDQSSMFWLWSLPVSPIFLIFVFQSGCFRSACKYLKCLCYTKREINMPYTNTDWSRSFYYSQRNHKNGYTRVSQIIFTLLLETLIYRTCKAWTIIFNSTQIWEKTIGSCNLRRFHECVLIFKSRFPSRKSLYLPHLVSDTSVA